MTAKLNRGQAGNRNCVHLLNQQNPSEKKSNFKRALNMFCSSSQKCITMIVYTVYIVYYIFFTNKNVNNSVKPINDLMEFESKLILLFRRHLCSLCLNVALPVLSRPGGIALLSTGYLLNAIKLCMPVLSFIVVRVLNRT